MFQVNQQSKITYEVKKSVFTSYLLPFSDFKYSLKNLQIEHTKANHIVWAYRYLNEFDQIVENSSDDGEPKGCAGNPTLSHLRGENLINTALITVRYFGGIKLGTGGMVRAYSSAAKEVINISKLEKYIKKSKYTIKTPYSVVKRYEHFFTQEKIDFSNRIFEATQVIWHLNISQDEVNKLENFQITL